MDNIYFSTKEEFVKFLNETKIKNIDCKKFVNSYNLLDITDLSLFNEYIYNYNYKPDSEIFDVQHKIFIKWLIILVKHNDYNLFNNITDEYLKLIYNKKQNSDIFEGLTNYRYALFTVCINNSDKRYLIKLVNSIIVNSCEHHEHYDYYNKYLDRGDRYIYGNKREQILSYIFDELLKRNDIGTINNIKNVIHHHACSEENPINWYICKYIIDNRYNYDDNIIIIIKEICEDSNIDLTNFDKFNNINEQKCYEILSNDWSFLDQSLEPKYEIIEDESRYWIEEIKPECDTNEYYEFINLNEVKRMCKDIKFPIIDMDNI